MNHDCTPGPWRIHGGRDVVSDHHTYAGLVAAVYAGGVDSDSEVEGNARLIVASLDLLAACEDALATLTRAVVAGLGGPPESNETWVAKHTTLKKLRAAIAKATKGE